MESISFCRRKFDAIPFCREMQRRYLAVPKINPKSSDAECSAAPKKRFQGNKEPLLFLLLSGASGRDSNSPSGRPMSRPGRTVLRTVRKGAGESLPAHQRRGSKETRNLFFFVVSGNLRKGLEQPVRPPCVPGTQKAASLRVSQAIVAASFPPSSPFGDCPRQKNAPGPPELGTGRAGGFAVFH